MSFIQDPPLEVLFDYVESECYVRAGNEPVVIPEIPIPI
jgi:hypothetical protein